MISKRLLGLLLAILIASVIYAYLQMPDQKRIEPRSSKVSHKRNSVVENRELSIPRLRKDLLKEKADSYSGVRRDLFFNVYHSVASEVPPAPAIEAPTEVIEPLPVVVAPPPPPPPTPQEVARKELSRYKFLGFFKKGVKQTIFLSANDDILLVRKGDYLGRDKRYYVVNITDSDLFLRKEGAGDFTIKLTDQETLAAVPIRRSIHPDASAPSASQIPEPVITPPSETPELVPAQVSQEQGELEIKSNEEANE